MLRSAGVSQPTGMAGFPGLSRSKPLSRTHPLQDLETGLQPRPPTTPSALLGRCMQERNGPMVPQTLLASNSLEVL